MELLPLQPHDEALVWEFLCLAAHETDESIVRQNPFLAHYAHGWGQVGDFGFKALDGGVVVGVGWGRFFSPTDPGFGWVGEDIPEISLAVREEFRGQGVGQWVMAAVVESARTRVPGLSLNVRAENTAAVRLYERCGFERIIGSERVNRTGGISFNMRLDF